jgi:hypothetical protein
MFISEQYNFEWNDGYYDALYGPAREYPILQFCAFVWDNL